MYHKSELQKEMNHWFKENLGYYPYFLVYTEINGTPMYLNKSEVIFLQYKCAHAYRMYGEEGYQKFINTHIVYNGRTKRHHVPIRFNKDGSFQEPFQEGFRTEEDLEMGLLKEQLLIGE